MLKKITRLTNYLHGGILFLCIYSVFCCGFHILPVWGYSENYVSINTTLLSLALSYIAGFVIYMFTSVLPRKQREEEVFSLWKEHLSSLYNEMSLRIEEVRVFAEIPIEKMASLISEDAKPLANYTDYESPIYIKMTIIKEDPHKPHIINSEFNIKKTLNEHYNTMQHLLGIMLNNPMAIDSNKKILDLLTRIKESSFLKECKRIIGNSPEYMGKKISITTPDLPQAFVEYVKLKKELAELPIIRYSFDLRKRTDEEVQESKKGINEALKKMGLTEESRHDITQKIANASKMKS